MWPFKVKQREQINVGMAEITVTVDTGESHVWTVKGKLFGGDEYVVDGVEAAHVVIREKLQAGNLMKINDTTYVPMHRVKDVKVGPRQDYFI